MKRDSEFVSTLDHAPEQDQVLKGGWYALWIAMLLILFANVGRQVLVLGAPPISLTLGLSDGELGMVQGLAVSIFAVLAIYPLAWAADRFDRRLVFGICVLIWSLGAAACGLARNFDQLLASAILMAAGEGGLRPIVVAFVPVLFKGRKRQLANSVSYFFVSLGIAGGLVLSGGAITLIDHLHGEMPASFQHFEAWRLAFFLVALPTPIFLVLLALTKLHSRSDRLETARDDVPRHGLLPFVSHHRRAMAPVFMGAGLYTLGAGSYLIWLPMVATRMFGATPGQNGAQMGIATTLGLLAGVGIGTVFVRRIMVRLGAVASIRLVGFALLGAIPVFVAFPFVTTSWQLYGLYSLLMVAYTAAGCAMSTIVQDMAPAELRGRMSALWTIVNVLMSGLSPSLIGWLSNSLGPEPRMLIFAMGVIAIPAWIASAVAFRMAEKPFAELARASNGTSPRPQPHAI